MSFTLLLISALLLTGPGLWHLKRAIIGRPRVKSGCWKCRFSLEGLPEGASLCPECGTSIVPVGQRPSVPRRDRAWQGAIGGVCLAPVAILVGMAVPIVKELPLFARLFPRYAMRSAPVGSWSALESAGAVFTSFAAGSASEASLKAAAERLATELEDNGSFSPGPGDPRGEGGNVVNSGYGAAPIAKIAQAIDTLDSSDPRFDTLLGVIASAYESHPVAKTTNIDQVLAGMLGGEWPERHSGGSSDYISPRAAPQAITERQTRRLIDMVLHVQADAKHPWNQMWGDALEQAFAAGRATAADMKLYMEQSFNPRIVVDEGTTPRRGDIVAFRIQPGWRIGSAIPVWARVTGAAAPLQGRIGGPIRHGEPTQPHMFGPNQYEGLIFLPDIEGPLTVDLEVTATMAPDIIDAMKDRVNPWHYAAEEPAWRKLPPVSVTKHATLGLTLTASEVGKTRLDAAGMSPAEASEQMGAPYLWFDGSVREARFTLGVTHGKLDVAFDAFLRQDGVEHPLGWSFGYRVGWYGIDYVGAVTGIDPTRPVDVILRPNLGLVERSFWAPTLWSGEFVFTGVTGRHFRLPADWGK